MLAQNLPPALQRIATTPILASERPAGFPHVKIIRLAANRHIHTLGGVRIDFSNSHATVSTSYALTRTRAAAVRLARSEQTYRAKGLFYARAVAVGRFTIGAIASTAAKAQTLLGLAMAHFRRSQQ